MNILNNTIVVAMSGGVDSSVAAHLLRAQGESIVGISMQVWDYRQNGGSCTRATCCSPDDFTDARKVAAKIDVPYYVFDFEETFRKEVIDNFIEKYRNALTPNPCVDCNRKVKFRELRNRAKAFGCRAVATGHYAQISHDAAGYHLLRGADLDKDQSYFLYGLTQDELSKTIFPVGHLTKPQVREIAAQAGLPTASKPESQDICFVSGSVKDFLVRLGGKKPNGKIVNRSGQVLGEHDGIHQFTVGQRKGLGVGGNADPLYILEINPLTNEVIVGNKDDLKREKFFVSELNWVAPQFQNDLPDEIHCLAQLRHRHKGVPVSINTKSAGSNTVEVKFLDEWDTVTPGQAAVFYCLDNKEVLGGGRIV